MKVIKISRVCFFICLFTISVTNAQSPPTKFFNAAKKINIELIENYLENGVDINSQDKNGKTILMHASNTGSIKLVSFLLDNGANIDLTDKNGATASSYARKSKNYHLLELFSFWREKEKNTMESYKNYISLYPKGQYLDKAEKEIEKFEYKDVLELNTLEGYNAFLDNYPRSSYESDIGLRIDTLDYIKANNDTSITSYYKYLNLHPSGAFVSVIESKFDSLLPLYKMSDDLANTIIFDLEQQLFPFTLNEIYVECSIEDDELDVPNRQHFSPISVVNMQILDTRIKYRTSKRVVDKEISTKVSIVVGKFVAVEILKGKETFLDFYSGDYEGKELIKILHFSEPVDISQQQGFLFKKVDVYEGEYKGHYFIKDDIWYKI